MKIKVISALFILVCIGIMIAGCSSPATSSQGNYPQQSNQVNTQINQVNTQSNQVNTQSSSNIDPIVGCWYNSYGPDSMGNTVSSKYTFDSKGSGSFTVLSKGKNTDTSTFPVNWVKLSDSGDTYHSKYNIVKSQTNLPFTYSSSSQTLTQDPPVNLVYRKINC